MKNFSSQKLLTVKWATRLIETDTTKKLTNIFTRSTRKMIENIIGCFHLRIFFSMFLSSKIFFLSMFIKTMKKVVEVLNQRLRNE